MQLWLIHLAIRFFLTQVAKFGASINIQATSQEAVAFLDKFVPKWAQHQVAGIIEGTVGAIAAALQNTAGLGAIIACLAVEDWTGALQALEALLKASVHPMAPAVAAAIPSLHHELQAA